MEIQELITRGRILFSRAPKRLEVFKLVNGRRGPKEVAIKVGKPVVPTLNDLQKMKNLELIKLKKNSKGKVVKKEGYTVYEKNPLISNVSISYFTDSKSKKHLPRKIKLRTKQKYKSSFSALSIPSAPEILGICKHGEDQIYEFKASGVDVKKITKKIGAFLNTKQGGLLFYGVEDDGTIVGTDMKRQKFDNRIQNSIKNTISPSATVKIKSVETLGHEIIVLSIPAWNRKDVYQYDGRTLIRKGTNDFVASPDEVRKLHQGKYVI